MTLRVIVAGAINTDLVATVDRAPEAGETVTGSAFAIHSGGKGANQAVSVARSGVKAAMLGGVGPDDFGEARKADLARDGINLDWVATIDDATSGVALITVDRSGENRICYIPAATLRITPDHALRAVETYRPDAIVAANELSAECHFAMFTWARDHGVPVFFNVAPFSADAVELVPFVDVLSVNRGEATALLGMGNEEAVPADLARGLLALGATAVVITLGGDGAYAADAGGAFHEPAFAVDVVDTTGAGDTFCGALAARMLEGATLRESVRYANAAGALATTRHGAQPSIPHREDVEALLASRS